MSATSDIVCMVARGARIGTDLLESLAGSRVVKDVGRRTCGSEIPPPCWWPKALGSVRSDVGAGGTATVRILVCNCGPASRDVVVEAAGADAASVTVSPGSVTLGPMERRRVTASLSLAATAPTGEVREALIWVRGCHDHYLRWTVRAACSGCNPCHEIEVDDCPDYIHHWYDHFSCDHPCPGQGR